MKRNIVLFNSGSKNFVFKDYILSPGKVLNVYVETNSLDFKNLRNYKFIKINLSSEILQKELLNLIHGKKGRVIDKMQVNVLNKAHFDIVIGEYIFKPFIEKYINVGSCSEVFKEIRSNKFLRVGRINNEEYIKRHRLKQGKSINFCYDVLSQHAGEAYTHAIEALATPIFNNLNTKIATFINRPGPGPNGKAINCRFFNSTRINQQGKAPVGPRDVFISHGIGDKNYWLGKHIKDFNFAFCPGPTWEKRMRDTGYKGKIFQVGYTKLDSIFNGQYTKNNFGKPCVVWAPTHGYNAKHKGRSSYPQCMTLINDIPSDYFSKMALHPTSKINTNKKHLPTMQDLVDADVIIADAGSTLYEAWILGKPVIFPDWICKKDVLSHFKNDTNNLEYIIYSKQIGYHAKDFKHLLKLIPIAIEKGIKDESREFIEGICPENTRGKAGKLAANALIDIKSIINK